MIELQHIIETKRELLGRETYSRKVHPVPCRAESGTQVERRSHETCLR